MHRHLSKITIIIMIILQAKPCFIYNIIYSTVYGFALRPINIYMLRPMWCVLSDKWLHPRKWPLTSNENLNEQQVMEIIRAVLLLHKLSLHLIKMRLIHERSGQTDINCREMGEYTYHAACNTYYVSRKLLNHRPFINCVDTGLIYDI